MSEEVKLRVLEKKDLEFVHKLTNDAGIMSYWFGEPHQSMAELEKIYEKDVNDKHMREFILTRKGDRLGFVALFSIDFIHRKAEFAIMIDPKHQGYGYASIATDLAMNYAFANLNLHKLYLIVDEMNEKAIHIYKKAGFEREAVLKEEFFVKGSYHNAVFMSIFQADYLNRNE